MPIGKDMNTMLREANETYQYFHSELSSLGMSTADFGAAAFGHVTGVATPIAVPAFESEVNHRPAVQQWAFLFLTVPPPVIEFWQRKEVIEVARVYRVDVSRLTAEQKREVDAKLQTISFMGLNRLNKDGLLVAFEAIEERQGDFTSMGDFKAALGLPEQCILTDVTGWDLRR